MRPNTRAAGSMLTVGCSCDRPGLVSGRLHRRVGVCGVGPDASWDGAPVIALAHALAFLGTREGFFLLLASAAASVAIGCDLWAGYTRD